ncbi:iron chelate uptake ABC transporter family permease subunit [Microbacterium sp. G2-8]|uniref:FecCD family ABC transporter permease n=1 Tax=Microbacterium sp. G2-8 TaxID=2842454 RepID=UPI001C890935|nr:iron chelate uptake ABC transporter family permease subunit [Microbacterium sp. G2-8]
MTDVRFAHRRLVLGRGRHRVVVRVRRAAATAAVTVVVLILGVTALALGDYPVAPAEVVGSFTGRTDGLARTAVLEWRLPRAASAIAFGAALGVAGAVFQTFTRNPLASPDVIGLASGAYTGMILTLIAGGGWAMLTLGSLAGGLAAAVAILMLASRDGLQGFRFIVVGIGVSAMLSALNTWLLLRAELETALFAAAWGAGSLNGVTAATGWPATAVVLVLLAAVPLVSRGLRQLDLGADAARASGVAVSRIRWAAIGLAVALVSVTTAVAGPISFVALAAPQIARRLAGTAEIPIAASAATGAAVLVASDIVAQHVIPLTVPVGVVTVVIGGGYLIWLLAHEIRKTA